MYIDGDIMPNVIMKDFLTQYFMQRHFNQMPAAQRAKLDDYIKKSDLAGNMKMWRDKLMHVMPNGSYEQNELPDPNGTEYHLTDDEWKKLFNAFQSTFQSMSANRESFRENKDAIKFLDEYFGAPNAKLFSNMVASTATETMIQHDLLPFLESHPRMEIFLRDWNILGDDDYGSFLNKIRRGEYNNNQDFQRTIRRMAQYISTYGRDNELLTRIGATSIPDFTQIHENFGNTNINPHKLDYFKNNYKSLLNAIHDKSKIRDVVAQNDRGKIVAPYNTAIEKVAYDNTNSKDYIPPKHDDELTPLQQIRKNLSDTFEDYFGKYKKLRPDHKFVSQQAEFIFKAIDGAKIKPTDGLEKIIGESDKIKKNLQYKSKTSVAHFDWFVKTLSELQSNMKNAFQGALRNARQMRAIVEELVIKAVENNKMDEAKTAMEILTVMQYGYTTSKIMDTLRKEKLSIFSDGGLTWNKNEGVAFVTKALDTSIKYAFLGVGYLITMTGNAINLSGMKFNGKSKRIKQQNARILADQQAQNQELQNQNAADTNRITQINNDLNALRNRGITEAALDTSISNIQTNLNNLDSAMSHAQNFIFTNFPDPSTWSPEVHSLYNYVHEIENKNYSAPAPTVTDPAIQSEITSVANAARLINPHTQAQLERHQKMRQKFTDGTNAVQYMQNQINTRQNRINNWDNDHKNKYRELMAHWDFLHTGKTSSWSLGSAKLKQKRFNQELNNGLLTNYINNYSMTA